MSDKWFYRSMRWARDNPGPTSILLIILAGVIYASDKAQQATQPSPAPAAATQAIPEPPDPRIEACGAKLQERRAEAKAAYVKKNYQDAFELLDYCNGRMQPDSLENQEYLHYAKALGRVIDAEKAAELKAEKARKKKAGVSLGMTMQDALDSSWGRPEKVNRSTNAYGTREQWVYGGGNYLYFENGVLTSIQN